MGIDAAWLPVLRSTVAIGNFANEMSSFYVMWEGGGTFSDDAIVAGIGPASCRALTFGLAFLDLDLDGRQDLIAANGHVEPEINRVQSSQRYAQPTQVFWNGGACPRSRGGRRRGILPLRLPRVGRGLAYADIDADGDPDVAITQTEVPRHCCATIRRPGQLAASVARRPTGQPRRDRCGSPRGRRRANAAAIRHADARLSVAGRTDSDVRTG